MGFAYGHQGASKDKAKRNDSRDIRWYLRIRANIARRKGRPYRFCKESYLKARSAVGRFFGWLKSFHRLAYERLELHSKPWSSSHGDFCNEFME